MQRLVLFTPPALSPTAAAIVAELRRQGFTASDDLKRWIADAVQAVNTRHYEVRATASDATAIGYNVSGNGQLRTWWGDGRTDRYQLTDTAQVISHTYSTAARRPIVLVGNVAIS